MSDEKDRGAPASSPRLGWSVIALTVVLMAIFPLFAAAGYVGHGRVGVWAAAVAGGICWLGATAALVLMGLLRGGPQVLYGLLLGIFFRMGLPLVVGLILNRSGGPLAEAGVFGMIVGYYLVSLFAETLLSVRLVGSPAKRVMGVS